MEPANEKNERWHLFLFLAMVIALLIVAFISMHQAYSNNAKKNTMSIWAIETYDENTLTGEVAMFLVKYGLYPQKIPTVVNNGLNVKIYDSSKSWEALEDYKNEDSECYVSPKDMYRVTLKHGSKGEILEAYIEKLDD